MKTTTKMPAISSPIMASPFALSGSLRTLTISNPSPRNEVSTNLKSNIILVAKYAFVAESENELSVKKGDILKLLDRPANGWLLVKFIDKVLPPGLIPAFYVDIAINDQNNPVTLNWLQSNSHQRELCSLNEQTYLHLQLKQSTKPPLTINNKAYPVSISISNFLLYNQRYWYRLDVVLSDTTQCYVCRYYQDFYNLHVNLLTLLNKASAPLNDTLTLPKLPEPIPSHNVDNADTEEDQIRLLLKRCNDLNVYINKLILNRNYQLSDTVIDWLDVRYKDLPGFKVKKDATLMDNDTINSKILPDSVNVIKDYYQKLANSKRYSDERTITEESVAQEENEPIQYSPSDSTGEIPKRTPSRKNIFNHYQQGKATNFNRSISTSSTRSQGSMSSNSSPITPNSTYNSTFHNSMSSTSSSSSPSLSRTPTNNSKVPYVKCKITNFNNDIVAIRFKKSLVRSVSDLKLLVKQKVYYSKLYIKLPHLENYENIDRVNINILEYLKHQDKFLLKLV